MTTTPRLPVVPAVPPHWPAVTRDGVDVDLAFAIAQLERAEALLAAVDDPYLRLVMLPVPGWVEGLSVLADVESRHVDLPDVPLVDLLHGAWVLLGFVEQRGLPDDRLTLARAHLALALDRLAG